MNQNQLIKKIGTIAMIVGVISLIISIICFIGLGVVSGKVEEAVGYKPTAAELSDIIDRAKSAAELFGGELQDIADFIGISAVELTLIQLFLALKIPTLIIGIIIIVAGIVLMLLAKNPTVAKKAVDLGSVATDSNVCPVCNSIISPEAEFCGVCGTELNKSKTVDSPTDICPFCKNPILPGAEYCGHCGKKLIKTYGPQDDGNTGTTDTNSGGGLISTMYPTKNPTTPEEERNKREGESHFHTPPEL